MTRWRSCVCAIVRADAPPTLSSSSANCGGGRRRDPGVISFLGQFGNNDVSSVLRRALIDKMRGR